MNFDIIMLLGLSVLVIGLVLYEIGEQRIEKARLKEIEDAIERSLVEAAAARLRERSIRSISPTTPVTFNEFNPAPKAAK